MRIAIFGTGGAGGYFGAQLARAGEDVVFIARGEHLRAIQENGLRIQRSLRIETGDMGVRRGGEGYVGTAERELSGEEFIVRAEATDDPKEVGEVDAVLVGVKAWQVADAARAMQPIIGPDTVVVPLQNGVDAAAELTSVLGEDHVLNGLCGTISRVVGPGRILSIGETNFIKFGEVDNRSSERVERLRRVFERARIKVEVPADIEAAVWEKFIFVTPYGGVGALASVGARYGLAGRAGETPALPVMGYELPDRAGETPALPGAGTIRSGKETRRMVQQGMEEILAVARARKIGMADGIVEKTMALLDSLDPNATTSLQRDIAAGRPSELEAWTGAVVRLGKESSVPTPVNDFIYERLLPGEKSARAEESTDYT